MKNQYRVYDVYVIKFDETVHCKCKNNSVARQVTKLLNEFHKKQIKTKK